MHFEEILKNLNKGRRYEVKGRFLASDREILKWDSEFREYISISLVSEDYYFIIHTNEWQEYMPDMQLCPVCHAKALVRKAHDLFDFTNDTDCWVECSNRSECGFRGPNGIDVEDSVVLWNGLEFNSKPSPDTADKKKRNKPLDELIPRVG